MAANNPFESGERKVIPAVLVYVTCGDEVLMLQRGGRPDDFHSGKWNGLGGKLEADESPLDAAVRETREESGLDLTPAAFRGRGWVQFPNFKPLEREDWWVTLFVADLKHRPKVLTASVEGTLHWIKRAEVPGLPLWEGDREFVARVLAGESVGGTIWYRDGAFARSQWL